jgi:mRNA interferase RelE/StbE
MKIEVSEQVKHFISNCPPAQRQRLRAALRCLADEKGDIKALERELPGYYRLRIQSHRIVFRYHVTKNSRAIFCAFVEHRGIVYEAFFDLLR